MPKKVNTIARRAWDLLRWVIFMAKKRGYLKHKLILCKKAISTARIKLFQSPEKKYKYIAAYQFSPDNSPVFQYSRKPSRKSQRFHLAMVILPCKDCFSVQQPEEEPEISPITVFSGEVGLSDEEPDISAITVFSGEVGLPVSCSLTDIEEEGDCVDKKAEKFIARFYEEMRIQREKEFLL
ncbi:hypothetical protein AMTRI_Chr13g85410 [Amborella trichopoda]|uniref:Uncharacterized protein n=1 Tax=Amborella trichopoda TaxID=13333 RepID=W1PAG6_AMBTC|nr:uncharacterized protein LOC18432162 [Amborella trichopoda]ERN04010.1 hypothetical protein AMTR_s00079p00164990 [Amborella trichopoda]|eukprot:XP_006842335.1 uncharacterized protein LOC18432162 [Amborella trichopoda]